MGSRKRSRPDPKVNTPLQEGCETQAGEASAQLGNDGSPNNTLSSQESAQKRTKTKDSDAVSITVRTMLLTSRCYVNNS
jgi:hypothetical protein